MLGALQCLGCEIFGVFVFELLPVENTEVLELVPACHFPQAINGREIALDATSEAPSKS